MYSIDLSKDELGTCEIWGSRQRGNDDGTVTDASFDEPVGVAFDGDVLFVACFGEECDG